MNRRLSILIAAIMAIAIGACAPQDTVSVDGPVPVTTEDGDPMGQHVANWDPNQCFSNDDCEFTELCVLNPVATAKLGFEAMRCETLCDADFEDVDFEDGTSKVEKVAGSDTCQRNGDEDWYCDMDLASPVCVEYTAEPGPCTTCQTPQPEPTDPEPTPDPVVELEFFSITCYWNEALLDDGVDYRVNFGGGVVGGAGGFHWNNILDGDASGTSDGFYRFDEVTKGFWVELTDGPVADDHLNWLGADRWTDLNGNGEVDEGELEVDYYRPTHCVVDGVTYDVGNQVQGCGFGTYDAISDGVSHDCHAE